MLNGWVQTRIPSMLTSHWRSGSGRHWFYGKPRYRDGFSVR